MERSRSLRRWRCLLLAGMAFLGLAARSAGLKDAESASHGDAAASYQVVDTYQYPGFKVIQFNLAVLSHYSYMLVSKGQALVVDPGRDVFAYVDAAKSENAAIKGVFLTHSHADFVAGHVELAKAAGCPIYVNAATQAGYKHEPLTEKSTLDVGDAQLRFLATPGHTPDGFCAMVFGQPRKDVPETMFTGDTLFVGSVGRPDLMGGTVSAAALASMIYDTWNQKLSRLADSVVIFPAHGAGSLCGAHLSDKPFSTIGAERASNPYLQRKGRSDFIAAVLDGLPEAPQYFQHNAKLNHDGPPLVDWKAPLPAETAPDARLAAGDTYVVDVRGADAYAAGHIPKSINIGVRGRLETWVGIMIPWGAPLVLTGSPAEVQEAVYRLHRVGYGAPGHLFYETWQKAGRPVAKTEGIDPRELHARMQAGTAPVIVDVRLPNEWMGLRIGEVVNLPLNHLGELAAKLDAAQPVVTVCNSACSNARGSARSTACRAAAKRGSLPAYRCSVRRPQRAPRRQPRGAWSTSPTASRRPSSSA
jgi:hydroxyacylglutathione hydrolase